MDPASLIGQRVMNRKTKARGTIISVSGSLMKVSYYGDIVKYSFPAAFADQLLLQNSDLQNSFESASMDANFDNVKHLYASAVLKEINYLKSTGGKKYRIIDGNIISRRNGAYIYSFDTDTEHHFPDGTAIKLWLPEQILTAFVISCEDFTIVFQTSEFIGTEIETLEFTAEPWQLMEALSQRINELDAIYNPIAYELACKGKSQTEKRRSIILGQDAALRKATSETITIIWGPPGTGKTTTLAKIAMEAISKGERVLMLSYSNVSVDGALLRVADMKEHAPGQVVRYGYPRVKALLESKTLTSYSYILSQNPALEEEYQALLSEKRKLKRKDPKRIEINRAISKIRARLVDKERELIQNASFVATTVSKAVVDKALYSQSFDTVIFDEASMAYVPQVIFAAGLAKKHFCCLGDFRQLPAIVQNPEDTLLSKDIFEFTGVSTALENGYGHNWLVMLNLQFRMHPKIADFASMYMYQGILYSAESIFEHRQAIADLPPVEEEAMGIVDLSKTYSVCIKTMDGSRINLLSALTCVKIAELFAGQYGVGIITPYSAQSRLVLAMLRDIQERNYNFKNVSCATVHQFQGSEKPVIIYDAVDCFRMQYPGTLLTSKKNDTANRLFNVALTRAQGKFIMVVNQDFMLRKKISKDLLFTKAMKQLSSKHSILSGEDIFERIGTEEGDLPEVFLGDRDEVDSWERYLKDIHEAKKEIVIDMPGLMDDDEDALNELIIALSDAHNRKAAIKIRTAEDITLPQKLQSYGSTGSYITTPFTLIDRNIIWFGEPLASPDFLSEGEPIKTTVFPCLRFQGVHTARMLKAIFEIPSL